MPEYWNGAPIKMRKPVYGHGQIWDNSSVKSVIVRACSSEFGVVLNWAGRNRDWMYGVGLNVVVLNRKTRSERHCAEQQDDCNR